MNAIRRPLLLLTAFSAVGYAQMELCGDGTTTGYTSLEAMDYNDMAISAPATSDPVGFVLCPGTILSTEWVPRSTSSVLMCGTDGNPENSCFVPGIVVPTNVTYVSVVGVTFAGFSEAAVRGYATSNTTVEIRNAIFKDFDSMFIVEQQRDDGLAPFRLELKDSTITNGTGGVAFANAGGELFIEDLETRNSSFVSLVSTGSSQQHEGSTFLRRVHVTSSDIESAFVVMEAADMDAIGVTIRDMVSMDTVFGIRGQGSYAAIDGIEIVDNDFSNIGRDVRWIGVDVGNRATASLSNFLATNSSHVRHVLSSSMESTLQVTNAKVMDMMGGRAVDAQDVSAIAFANTRAFLDIARLEVDDIDMFTAVVFGNAESNVSVRMSCFGPGSSQAGVYASEETTIESIGNFVDPTFRSIVCGEPGEGLVQESPGSGCFQTNRTDCSFECQNFFAAQECMADSTDHPSSSPSIARSVSIHPSLTPSMAPSSSTSSATTNLPTSYLNSSSSAPTSQQVSFNLTLSPTPARVFDVPTSIGNSVTEVPGVSNGTLSPTNAPSSSPTTEASPQPSSPMHTKLTSSSPTSTALDSPTTTGTTSEPTAVALDSPTTTGTTNETVTLVPTQTPGSPPSSADTFGPSTGTVEAPSSIEGPTPTADASPSAPPSLALSDPTRPTASLTGAPALASAEVPTELPTSHIVTAPPASQPQSSHSVGPSSAIAYPAASPVLHPATRPTDQSASPEHTSKPALSMQPAIASVEQPTRHKPSYIATDTVPSMQPIVQTDACDCDFGVSSKSEKKKSSSVSKGKRKKSGKGKSEKTYCHCSEGKSHKGGKGRKKGYIRHPNHQANHALHGLDR